MDNDLIPDDPAGPGLDRGRVDDAIYQPFNPAPMEFGPGGDGLPSPKIASSLPLAPPLSAHTLICLGDTSEFVIRDRWGEVRATFKPEKVHRAAGGAYFVTLEEAIGAGTPWLLIVRRVDPRTLRLVVQPKRPQCNFLAQQMVDFQDNTEHQMVERLCTARRDEESFFLSLRDSQVHACELRSPRDSASDRRLEEFNEIKMSLGQERLAATGEEFDVDKALAREKERAGSAGGQSYGIFGDRKDS